MYDWQDGHVETNGIRVHYWRTGGGKPPVVLLHGITDNGLCWHRLARELQDAYEVIMVDARGHGDSDKPESGYELKDYAADYAGLIESLALGKPAVMGHSLGAASGSTLASLYPERVGCLVLEDPPWRTPAPPEEEETRRARMADWREETRQRQQQMSHAEIAAAGKARSPNWHEDEFEPWAQAKLQVTDRVFARIGEELGRWQTVAASIQCPTLLITGDPELGGIVAPEVAAEVTRHNLNIRAVRLAGAGHNIHREQYEPFLETVRGFLAQHARQ